MNRRIASVSSQVLVTGLMAVYGVRAVEAGPPKAAAAEVLEQYMVIHDALAADTTFGVAEAAKRLAAVAKENSRRAKSSQSFEALTTAAGALEGGDLAALRSGFGKLTAATDAILREARTPGWKLYYCSMIGGYWIQTGDAVENPYYGKSMLACGDVVSKIEVDE